MSPDLTEATSRGGSGQRRRTFPWAATAIAAGMVVVAACGGGGETSDGTDPTGPTSAPTSVAASSSAPPTTMATTPSPTDPPATDPVTEPPPTTLDPVALDAQIRADFEQTWAAYFECVYDPSLCPFGSVNVDGSPLDQALRETVDELLRNNLRAGRNTGRIDLSIEQVNVLSASESDLQVCLTDGAVLFDVQDPANPDDDIVMNDALNSYRNVYRMRLIDGRWLRHSGEQLQVFAGVPGCGA